MGNFITTERKNTIDSLVLGLKDRLNNPYYLHTDKKATIVDYFNINTQKSTLDEALKIIAELVGSNSPIKYNTIEDFFIYGLDRIQISLEAGDFGTEASSIEGEAYILPKTIIPLPGDFFRINYMNKYYLFKVLDSTIDTMENGANFYKIQYKYDDKTDEDIQKQVDSRYTFIPANIGSTVFSPVIRNNDFEFASLLDEVSCHLKNYYVALFYNNRVESFTFKDPAQASSANFYDPYMTEFITRNNILRGTKDFILIKQQLPLSSSFVIDYDYTFFRSLELKDKENLSIKTKSVGQYIDHPLSLLSMRKENYFKTNYIDINAPYIEGAIAQIPNELYYYCKGNNRYTPPQIDNIIIDYFNGGKVTKEYVTLIEAIIFEQSVKLFYYIPMIIFILDQNIKELMGEQFTYFGSHTLGSNTAPEPKPGEIVWNNSDW